jgi:hypothetical protein
MNVVRRVQTTGEPALLRITAAQFSVMVEAGAFTGDRGVELRGGLLYEMNRRYVPHARAKGRLFLALVNALQAIEAPLEVLSEGSVKLGESEMPLLDLVVWEPVQVRGPVPGERVRLLVEVSDTPSPTTSAASARSTPPPQCPSTGSSMCSAAPCTSIGRPRTAFMRAPRSCPSAERSARRRWRASPSRPPRWT